MADEGEDIPIQFDILFPMLRQVPANERMALISRAHEEFAAKYEKNLVQGMIARGLSGEVAEERARIMKWTHYFEAKASAFVVERLLLMLDE